MGDSHARAALLNGPSAAERARHLPRVVIPAVLSGVPAGMLRLLVGWCLCGDGSASSRVTLRSTVNASARIFSRVPMRTNGVVPAAGVTRPRLAADAGGAEPHARVTFAESGS